MPIGETIILRSSPRWMSLGGLLLTTLLFVSPAHPAIANEDSLAKVQTALYAGKLQEADRSAQDWIASQPANQNGRFARASVHFFQAVEALGQGFYKYGLWSVYKDPSGGLSGLPFLRLPIPQNPHPERASYDDIRAIFGDFYARLQAIDAELAAISLDDTIDLPLDLMQVRLDFRGDGGEGSADPLWAVLQRVSGAPIVDPNQASNLVINFDAADVVWLRGYCHLLSAITDFLLAHDWRKAFEVSFYNVFPNSNPEFSNLLSKRDDRATRNDGAIADLIGFIHLMNWPVAEPQRMRSALTHLEAMTALSRTTWKLILAETDDRNEWIPGPHQTPTLPGLRVTEERLRGWQSFLNEFDAVLQGKKLIPHFRFDKGINLRRFFLEPTTFDPVLLIQGSAAAPYLEDGEMTSAETWLQMMQLFEGNFLTYFIWLN
jgi:hypothetical protein